MAVQPPPPPPIAPRQLNLLRVVAALAWADGNLAEEEVDLMLDRFSELFAETDEARANLKEDLREYLVQNLPLEELVPKLQTDVEKELALKLSYEVIAASARTPEESKINEEESAAYAKLLQLLDLPLATVQRIKEEVTSDRDPDGNLVDSLVAQIADYASR